MAAQAPSLSRTQAQNDLLRTRIDMVLQTLQRERDERRRDMEAIYAALASRPGDKVKSTWWRVVENMAIVAGTVLATYLAQKYLVGALRKDDQQQANAAATMAAAAAL